MKKERFLLVGGGGRESAFALRLTDDASVSAFVTHRNPTIAECVERTEGVLQVGDVRDAEAVARFARAHAVDYAFVSADDPLAHGVVDALIGAGIRTIGATRDAARIEWDKIYAMRLMQEAAPEFTPGHAVVQAPAELAEALGRFRELGQEVVVKPQGLTGGKGVKVMPEHLADYAACEEYARQLFAQRPDEQVLLVEKLNGVEFTIMGLTDGRSLVLPPACYDYPFRYENDTGPGTGGMGCFTAAGKKLPFLSDSDIRDCETIMRLVLARMASEGRRFNGVLNGGFFKTPKGIRFMEFNSRFGDPEGLNILTILKSPFSGLLESLWAGRLSERKAEFIEKASVIKYLVAGEYPAASPETRDFRIDVAAIRASSVNVFFGACEHLGGDRYRTLGSSRVLALGATAADIPTASDRVNAAIDRHVKGDLEYRRDIGSQADIDRLQERIAPAQQAAEPDPS